ncbi:hypothetical protein CHUAL_005549 [Chamberlinius hualienensis]
MNRSCIKMTHFWFIVTKECLGIICYSLFTHCLLDDIAIFCNYIQVYEHGFKIDFNVDHTSLRTCYVGSQVPIIACVAFTFVIEPATIITYLLAAKHYERTCLNQVFSLAGFISYITGGPLIWYYTKHNWSLTQSLIDAISTPEFITGLMFLVTSTLYLVHLIYALSQGIQPQDLEKCKATTVESVPKSGKYLTKAASIIQNVFTKYKQNS